MSLYMRDNGNIECMRAVECVCRWKRSWLVLVIGGYTDTAVHGIVRRFVAEFSKI